TPAGPTTQCADTDTRPARVHHLSLHDALPIWMRLRAASAFSLTSSSGSARWASSAVLASAGGRGGMTARVAAATSRTRASGSLRSEEHTSELQSPYDLVCRLLVEKKKRCRVHR